MLFAPCSWFLSQLLLLCVFISAICLSLHSFVFPPPALTLSHSLILSKIPLRYPFESSASLPPVLCFSSLWSGFLLPGLPSHDCPQTLRPLSISLGDFRGPSRLICAFCLYYTRSTCPELCRDSWRRIGEESEQVPSPRTYSGGLCRLHPSYLGRYT